MTIFKETSVFTRRVEELLDAESYRLLQLRLLVEPEAGDLIRGTRGLRKIRWQGSSRGTRGGVRVIYYVANDQDVIMLLLIYRKARQDDLTPDQKKALRRLVEEELE